MGLIREPKNVDFFVIDNPWTEEEKLEFSALIVREKTKLKHSSRSTKTSITTKRIKHFA